MSGQRKTSYQKAVERAQAKGFSSPYAERKARALAKGYTSPRTQRNASEAKRGIKRDVALERERANIRANAEGFRSATERSKFAKLVGVDKESWQKQRTLEYFGISERKFNAIRRANREWKSYYAQKEYTQINTYDIYRDKDVHNWSEYRVGYILSFYGAIVNPSTNYDSLTKSVKIKGLKAYTRRGKSNDGLPLTNKEQFYYLVKYANIMKVDEFESRYGKQAVQNAIDGKLEL